MEEKKDSKFKAFFSEFGSFCKSLDIMTWIVLVYFVGYVVYAALTSAWIIPFMMTIMLLAYFSELYLTYLCKQMSDIYRELYFKASGLDKLYKDL